MGSAEEIRRFVFENYVEPSKKQGETKLVVVSGEVRSIDRVGSIRSC